jgi:hypothetical protein
MALPDDIESQLAAMDARLRRLQEELEAEEPLLGDAPVQPDPAPAPVEPAPAAPAASGPHDDAARIAQNAHALVDRLTGDIEQLLALRDQLQASGRILVGDFQATLARMESAISAASALADPPQMVAVTIGPVHGLPAISAAAREIGGLPGVREVSVRRFERDTAVLDVHARSAADLAAAVREQLAPGIFVTAVGDGAVTLTVARELS